MSILGEQQQYTFVANNLTMNTRLLILISFLSFLSCKTDENIDGFWKVKSEFYRATYHVHNVDHSKKAQVIAYSDGTSSYTDHERPNQYVFNNLKQQEGVYVDAISGATKTSSLEHSNHIRVKHKDTIEVTTFIMGKPLKELWIRTTK